jgi:hypothetical protein
MKTVYLAWVFHGNMSYDRYTKHTIRRQFPLAYQVMIDEFMQYPELKGHVELSGLSVETLRLLQQPRDKSNGNETHSIVKQASEHHWHAETE